MDCPPKQNGRFREVTISGDSTVVDNRKEIPYLDENSFGFSLFVDVRFKLCSVVLIWIKHPLLFRNAVEPPLTATNGHFSAMAIFFLADSPYIHSCFNLSTTCLLWPLSSVPNVAVVEVQLLLESNDRPRFFVFFFSTTRNCRISAKEKGKKKRESRTRHRSR